MFVHAPIPMHEVAPSAVKIAVAIDAMSCTMNLMVSFLLIVGFNFKWLILILLPVISSVVERSHSEIEDLSMRYA
jgi:hypothetical protein